MDVGPDGTVGGAGFPGGQLHAKGQLGIPGVAALTVSAKEAEDDIVCSDPKFQAGVLSIV